MLLLLAPFAHALEAQPVRAPVGVPDGVPADIAQAIWQIEVHRLPAKALDTWSAHPSPRVRERVADALGHLRTAEALAPLGTLAKDADPGVRAHVAFALGQTPEAGPVLGRRWAVETDKGARARLAIALGKQGGPDAIDMLLPALEGPTSVEAAEGLGRLAIRKVEGASGDRVVAALLDTMGFPPVRIDTRRRAAWALARMGMTRTSADNAMRMRQLLLTDGDPLVRAWLLRAWVAVATEAARLDVLGLAANDTAPAVRIAVARGAGKHNAAGLTPLLTALLQDPNIDVRCEAATAAGAAPGVDVVPLLTPLLVSLEPIERAAAIRALAAKGELADAITGWTDAKEPLVVRVAAVESGKDRGRLLSLALRAPEAPIRSAAASVLLGDDVPRIPELLELLGGNDLTIAEAAAQTLADHPDPSAEAPLVAYLGRIGLPVEQARAGIRALSAIYATGRVPRPGVAATAAIRPWLRAPALEADAARLAALLRVPLPAQRHPSRRLPTLADVSAIRSARIWTSTGEVRVTLFPEEAPLTVWNFAKLAEDGYYDGLVFHRVVPDFVIQTGDPRGDGWGGPGYELPDEINAIPYTTGTLGMALSGPDTGGSQWFITLSPQPHLNGTYTVFGQVSYGMQNAAEIHIGDTIDHIDIERVPGR